MRNERISFAQARRIDMLTAAPWSMLEKQLLAAIGALTLFFVVLTPPFQAPDENQHYMKALLLSEGGWLTDRRGDMVGAELPRAAVDLHAVDFPIDPTGKAQLYDRGMLQKAFAADESRTGHIFADFPNVASYAPTLYAPGAAGLLIGGKMAMPRLEAFYLGRLVNALTGLALLAIALTLMPFGRFAMLATALLPTFAYQTGSLSPDSVINGLGFLGLALALRVGFMGSAPARTTGMIVTAPLLALCKGVYLPLMAAGLRWPAHRRDVRPWLLTGAIGLGAAIFVLWMKASGGSQALYHIASRKTGESMMTAPLAEQMAVILHDPVGYARIFIASVTERAPVYALQIVGRFGWNAILLPLGAYILAAVMLVAGVASGSESRFGVGQRIWWLVVAAGVAALIETAMYLTGTPLGADYIQGTQGRYFLPVLPLVLLALSPAQPVRGARPVLAAAALLLLSVAAASAYDSFWVHGFVTADGMPPHGSIQRALLLPSPRW